MEENFIPENYLRRTEIIDFDDPAIAQLAERLKSESGNETELVRRSYEFVRDKIAHSADIQGRMITCKASEVLAAQEGTCFAKSHLLVALLRANGIHCGFAYQRLRGDHRAGSPFVLHALNAVYLEEFQRWIRLDARGNQNGINAQFSINEEKLAYTSRTDWGELDYPSTYSDPAENVLETLSISQTFEELWANLPQDLLEEPSVEQVRSAEQGDPEAAYQLGKFFLKSNEEEDGFMWMQRAFEHGSDKALNGLGVCYLYGFGVEQNVEKAVELLQKAKEKNVTNAFYNLGQCYYNGWGIRKDTKKALRLIEHAAKTGLPEAVSFLTKIYLNSDSKRQRKKAFQYLLAAEHTHDPEILYNLAACYLNGYGTKRNNFEAIRIMQLNYSPDLTYLFGWCYLHGRGIEKNLEQANTLFLSAAENGSPCAQYEWGCSLRSGRGTTKNREEAVGWLSRAAEQDFPWDEKTEKQWRFSQFIMCCAFIYWIMIPMIGVAFAVDVVQKLSSGHVSLDVVALAISSVFLLAGPICYWGGIFCSLRLARWGCVLMVISGIELTYFVSQDLAKQPGTPMFYHLPIVLLLFAGLFTMSTCVCINTARRTYWLNLKRNKREISFLLPGLLCFGVYLLLLGVRVFYL